MSKKPTYKELEQRVKKLEGKVPKLAHVEEELERKSTELNSFINNLPAMAWLKDTESRFIAVNSTFGEAVGMNPESLINQTCEVCFGKEEAKKFREDDQKVMKSQTRVIIEEKITDSQENDIWLETIKSPILDESGKVLGTVGIANDITNNKQAEEGLRKSQYRYDLIFNGSRDAIFITGADAKFVDVNDAASVLTGHSKSELKRMSIPDLHEKVDLHAYETYFESIMAGEPALSEAKILKKDGTKVDTEFSNTRITVSGIPFMHTVARDITERKRVEELLRKQTHDLDERVKELNCLYGISKIRERNDIAFEEMLQEIVDLIPPSWQYPETTCARIIIEGQEYKTKNFKETVWKQTSNIIVHDERIGIFEICYLEEKPESDEGPFLKEERSLISAIAERLGRVTEHKQAQEALQLERDNFINILNSMEDGVYIVNQQYDIEYANSTLHEEFGPFVGRKCFEYFHNLKEACEWCKNQEVFVGKTVRWEWYSSKNQKTYDLVDTPLKNLDGSISKLEIFRDITDRKRAEEALRESEEKYSNLFHFSNDGIFVHDLEGNILDVNQKALDQLGYTKSEMHSFKIPDFHPPEALEKSQRAFETIIREGFVSFETDFTKKTGEVFPTEVSSSLFEIGDKKVIQGIIRDITERKQAEEDRVQIIYELQEALKEIKTLRGILPLCSFCKSIRDDKGYWEQVDVYIHKYSEADISHSICPDCMKKHYPEEYEDMYPTKK